MLLHNIRERFLDALFPSRCLNCETITARGSAACEICLRSVPLHTTYFCGRCQNRLAENRKICHPTFPYLLGAATDYDNGTVRALILGLKFKNVRSAALPLADLLIRYAKQLPLPRSALLLPIPLSRERLRERGFNQSELIARRIALHLSLPFSRDILIRTKNTTPQSSLETLSDREKNVIDCFHVDAARAVRGRTVVLIDDVTTTGSTLHAASLALKNAGTRRVIALVPAKA